MVIGILLVVVIYQKINRQEPVLQVLSTANPIYILMAVLLLIPHFYVAFVKWRYLLRIRFNDLSNRDIFNSLLFGITLGMVTPGNLGELGRGLFFRSKSQSVVTGLTVVDKLSNMLVMATLGFISISLLVLNQFRWEQDLEVITLIGGSAFLGGIWTVLMRRSWIRFLFAKAAALFPGSPNIQSFMSAFRHIKQRDVFVVLALTLSWFCIIALQYHLLILAFTGVGLGQTFQAVMAAMFTKMLLPVSFGGLGVREGVTVFYFSQFNISSAAVFSASLIIFFINFLFPALIGFYHVLRLNGPLRESEAVSLETVQSNSYSPLGANSHAAEISPAASQMVGITDRLSGRNEQQHRK